MITRVHIVSGETEFVMESNSVTVGDVIELLRLFDFSRPETLEAWRERRANAMVEVVRKAETV